MKISVDPIGDLMLEEIFSSVKVQTTEGNWIGLCMRDGTFDISVPQPNGDIEWWRVRPTDGDIIPIRKEKLEGSYGGTTTGWPDALEDIPKRTRRYAQYVESSEEPVEFSVVGGKSPVVFGGFDITQMGPIKEE